MDIYIKKLLEKFERKHNLSFELFWFTDRLVVFANRGSNIELIKDSLNRKLKKKYNHMLKSINYSTGHIVPVE